MGTFDIRNDSIKYIKSDLLGQYSIAISLKSKTVNSGDMSDNDGKNIENRQMFFRELNIEDRNHIHNKQIHSSIILPADNRSDCDGVYSSNYSHALYILTADCYNIF
ncbi:laccase domain-containing protein, partial [candidate division WOR-3 bacterium]|nr:laccase domain-containing protein [candidate division WOR-3 bacterium]